MSNAVNQIVDAEFEMNSGSAIEQDQAVVPFDENLLEQSRTQWQFGHWESLLRLDRESIQHHPDRAKLALFAASARLVSGNFNEAVQYLQWAKDLGVSRNTLLRVLMASAQNTLARLAILINQPPRALKYYEQAIQSVTPGVDAALFARARLENQFQSLNVTSEVLLESSEEAIKPVGVPYLFFINSSIESKVVSLGFNKNSAGEVVVSEQIVSYDIPDSKPLYFVSTETGSFEKAPIAIQVPIEINQTYLVSGKIDCKGNERPIIWVFQYADGKRLDSTSQRVEDDGQFKIDLKLSSQADSIAFGIRLSGSGHIDLSQSYCNMRSYTGSDALESIDTKINQFKSLQKQEVEKSMKQIEATMRLQNYLGSDVFLPDMHNWAISPDFGVFLVNQIEQNDYDAIIEFGSGTSTVLISKVIGKRRSKSRVLTQFVSFDHLEEYRDKTAKLLKQADVEEECALTYAPLIEWMSPNNESYQFYDCQSALQKLRQRFQKEPLNLLVIVDGPPAVTGKHARYPALLSTLQAFLDTEASIDFLLDDYCRDDEKEMVVLWKSYLDAKKLPCVISEYKKLEKQACLLQTKLTGNSL